LQASCLLLAQKHVLGLRLLLDAQQQVLLAANVEWNGDGATELRSEERSHPLRTIAAPEDQALARADAVGRQIAGGAICAVQQFGIRPTPGLFGIMQSNRRQVGPGTRRPA